MQPRGEGSIGQDVKCLQSVPTSMRQLTARVSDHGSSQPRVFGGRNGEQLGVERLKACFKQRPEDCLGQAG
ncbi:hypothetical protein BDW75DRAFT_206790 [Aspergillus navahoensis]